MEKILFLLAVIFAVLAISSRHHLKSMQTSEDDDQSVETNLKGGDENPQSLGYALNKMTNQTPKGQAPIQGNKASGTVESREDHIKEVDKAIKDIQLSNEESPAALERALSLTTSPEDMSLKYTVLQAALSLQGDNLAVRNSALREALALQVPENFNSESPTPEEVATRDLQRNIVITSFKVYIQNSVDPESTYNDTMQIINYQSDPWVKRQIGFECTSRFPQLRERINEQ